MVPAAMVLASLLQPCKQEFMGSVDSPAGKGYYMAPTLMKVTDPSSASAVHRHEVFGPCASIVPYSGDSDKAATLVAKGQGCLVSSVYGGDRKWLGDFLLSAASWNGRMVVVSPKVADSANPPGLVLPNQVHGGPGRAGGGEELGGVRGMDLYTNRVAIQGDSALLNKLLK